MSAAPQGVDVLAVRNPFRNKHMRQAFDDAVRMYNTRHKNLFRADGKTAHRGNSWAGMFWRGYEGTSIGQWDAASRKTMAYPTWRAGVEVRAALSRIGSAK